MIWPGKNYKQMASCKNPNALTKEILEATNLLRDQINGHDQTIKTQDFSKNQNEDHADKEAGLLGCSTYTSITNNTQCETCSQS